MPELPEVETTLRGIQPHIEHQKITCINVRNHQLRWLIPKNINKLAQNQPIELLTRRGKYMLLTTPKGTLIIHLGMSGRLRVLTQDTPIGKHDHVDIVLSNQKIVRFTDPRRFGAILWTDKNPLEHLLLKNLGPEPLSKELTGDYLWQRAKNRKMAIKSFIMDSKIVVGVGNIYAAEALFSAGIYPLTPAGKISKEQFDRLTVEIKKILRAAIKQGGTTLKDFTNSEGKPGYFSVKLKVYGRGRMPCVNCKTELIEIRLGQRSTVFCAECQK